MSRRALLIVGVLRVTVIFACACVAFPRYACAQDKKLSLTLSSYIMALVDDDLGNVDQAIAGFEKALRTDEANTDIRLSLAACFIKKNDITRAIKELEHVSRLDPQVVESHALLALLYFSQNNADLAGKEYELALKNAVEHGPKNVEIYKGLGAMYIQQKKFKEASDVYRAVIDLTPNDAQAHFYLGYTLSELGSSDQVESELLKAIELKADYHAALNFLGYFWVDANKNLDKAGVMIHKALELDPENGAYVDSLGWWYFRKGQLADAQSELERASKLYDDAEIFEHLGDVYLKVNDPGKARIAWEHSLKLEPERSSVKKRIESLK